MVELAASAARAEQVLKRTTSRCPICQAPCPAEVWRRHEPEAKVFLRRICPQHGEAEVCISSALAVALFGVICFVRRQHSLTDGIAEELPEGSPSPRLA